MDNELYIIGGIAFLIVGLYITTTQIKKIRAGEEGKFGFDYRLLGGAVMFVIIGVASIVQHI